MTGWWHPVGGALTAYRAALRPSGCCSLSGNVTKPRFRYAKGGHCRRHRHVASTVTLVLEGEQFLEEMLPDGTTQSVHRKQGDYALAPADAHPHGEHGGDAGATVLLSMTAPDGILFEYFDENMKNGWTLSIKEYVGNWNNGTVHGAAPGASKPTTV